MSDSREAFEKFAREHQNNFFPDFSRCDSNNDDYWGNATQKSWQAWQHQQSRIDSLEQENAALRAQLGQGEAVGEIRRGLSVGTLHTWVDLYDSAHGLPEGKYFIYTAQQSKPVTEHEAMGKSWMEFAAKQKPYCVNVSAQDGFTAGWQARAALGGV